MNLVLWVIQVLAALLYPSSAVMKIFFFDGVSKDVPSFGALPRSAWLALGIFELLATVALIVPAALRWHPHVTVVAAVLLAMESLIFIWVHMQYKEPAPIVMSAVLGILMTFVAYGRCYLSTIR